MQKDLSLNFLYPHEKPGMGKCTPVTPALGTETGGFLELAGHQPSPGSIRDPVSREQVGAGDGRTGHLMPSCGQHLYIHTYTHVHT